MILLLAFYNYAFFFFFFILLSAVISAQQYKYTLEDVAAHDNSNDCWSVVSSVIYDVTAYGPDHPDGARKVWQMCGVDSTDLYLRYHPISYMTIFPGIVRIGTLQQEQEIPPESNANAEYSEYTLEDVARHGDSEDCWSVVSGVVYDVTAYGPTHPDGPSLVWQMCGIDSTDLYLSYHPLSYMTLFPAIRRMGTVYIEETNEPTSAPSTTSPTHQPTPTPTTQSPTLIPTQAPTIISTAAPTNSRPTPVPTSHQTISVTLATNAPSTLFPTNLPSTSTTTRPSTSYPTSQEPSIIISLEPSSTTTIASSTTIEPSISVSDCISRNDVIVSKQGNDGNTVFWVSWEELQLHATSDNCWVSYYSEVYDVSVYALEHDGGASVVTADCGTDGTTNYALFHDRVLLVLIQQYYIGELDVDGSHTTSTAESNIFDNDECLDSTTTSTTTTSAPQSQSSEENSVDLSESTDSNSNAQQPSNSGPVETDSPSTTLNNSNNNNNNNNNGLIRMATLQQHATPEDCWVAYFDQVYDMTTYANEHPPGAGTITANCGEDGTKQYKIFHDQSLLALVQQYFIGDLDTTVIAETDADAITDKPEPVAMALQDVQTHNRAEDCYVIYHGNVYDLTYYSHPNPPGQSVIYETCGVDGTLDFASAHPRRLLDTVESFRVGWIEDDAYSGATDSRLRCYGSSVLFLSLIVFSFSSID